MATLRYKNPKTGTWDLLNGGGEQPAQDQIIFGTITTFPSTGDKEKMYVDTLTNKIYIYTDDGYQLAGDGSSNVEWGEINV